MYMVIVLLYIMLKLDFTSEKKQKKTLYIQNGIVLCGKVFSTLRHRRTQANNTIFEQRVKRKCFISGNYLMNLCICWIFFLNYDFLFLFLLQRFLGNRKLQSVRNYFHSNRIANWEFYLLVDCVDWMFSIMNYSD